MKKLIAAFASIIIIPLVIGLVVNAVDDYLTANNISYNKLFVVLIISFIVIAIVFYVGYFCFSLLSKRISILQVTDVVSSYVYNGTSLFEISNKDTSQFGMLTGRKSTRVFLATSQFFGNYPVIYYNVTAKSFLNWIDYLYLKLLNDLSSKCNAKIIISLHVDEPLLNEGLYDGRAQEQYLQLKEKAIEIIKKVVPKAHIGDEFAYYLKADNSMKNHPEYFIGTIISNINYYVKQLAEGTITYDKFIRKESNILSVMPISVLSRKYHHLFVLDYAGSFDVWKLQPYESLKQQNNIFFIACGTIKDKKGERIPSWDEADGVNFTDNRDVIGTKIRNNDITMNSALYEIYTKNSSSDLSEEQLQVACIDLILGIKNALNL